MDYDLEGELAELPRRDVQWACPACRRVVVERQDDKAAKARACAGDPITGATHALEVMVRTPRVGEERPPPPAVAARVLPFRRRLVSLDQLEAMVAADKANPSPNYCATCGPLVEVDNPLRREVRHRRGCPTREA